MKPTRPALKYHGSKWRIAPWVISHFPAHKIYVEPFCGAVSVLMRKGRTPFEIINDLDGNIVTVFQVLRDPVRAAELELLCRLTPFARDEYYDAFQEDQGLPDVERARRLIFRSFAGFGSVGFSRKSPPGFCVIQSGNPAAQTWAGYPDLIPQFTARLAGVAIENRPAIDVIRQYDGPDTLHYIDPPYTAETRTDRDIYSHEMTDADHPADCAGPDRPW